MRLNSLLRATASAAVVGAVAFGFAGAASAQESDQPTTVDDIIVTAQKREQNLQDVPVVVTTLSETMLENAGVRDIKDLQVLTPGLTVTSTQSESSTTARIRGVGTVGDNPGLESSVGVVIDGVYRSRNSVGFGDLGELQRIEVLKGPQGTLFGKNTSAGVINILTEAPSFNPSYELEATAGNYGAHGVSGSITGPLADSVAFRLFGAYRQRDGFYNVDTGDGPRTQTDDANQDYYTVRGQLLVQPSETVSIRAIADYTRRDEYCCTGVIIRTGPTGQFVDALSTGTGVPPAQPGFAAHPFSRLAYSNRDTGQKIEDRGVSIEANIDLSPSMTLTSITSGREWETKNGMDIDYTGADVAYRNQDGNYGYEVNNLTQEFRLAGANDRVDWLVGAFFTKEEVNRNDSFVFGPDYNPLLAFQLSAALNAANPAIPVSPNIIGCFTRTATTAPQIQGCLATGGTQPAASPLAATGPTFGAGNSLLDRYEQDGTSYALFTNNTVHITDALDLTVGLRYTFDEKDLTVRQTNVGTNQTVCGAGVANQAAIAGAVGAANAPAILGRLCLPWVNPGFANRNVTENTSDNDLSGTAKLSYRISPEAMVYASYARGYKSFGYNQDRVLTPTLTPVSSLFFPSETVDSYELGAKLTLLDRSLLLNATYFDQKFENFQLNTFLGTSFVVESIPELTSRGVDADFLWFTPVEGLNLQGGVTYTDAEYGRFTAADLFNPGNFPQLSLLPGARPSFAPEWSASGSFNYERSLGSGLRLGLSATAKYMSEYNTGSDLLPFKMQDAFTTVNGRITIGAESERWELDLWGQNLTDEEYVQVAYNAFLQGSAFQSTPTASGPYAGTFYNPAGDSQTYAAFLGQPRTYGVTLRLKY